MMSTVGEIQLSSSSIDWKIGDFASLPAKPGEYYRSPPFDFYDVTWCILIYPNSCSYKLKYCNYISVFLKQLNNQESSHVVFQRISIKKSDGTDYISREIKNKCYKSDVSWGLCNFLKRAGVLKVIAPRSDLTISFAANCDHSVANAASGTVSTESSDMSDRETRRQSGAFSGKRKNRSGKEKEKLQRSRMKFVKLDNGDQTASTSFASEFISNGDTDPQEPKILWKNLVRNMKESFLNRINCDVVIKVKEQEFPAHRMILVSRSTVFAAMFEHNMSENRNGVVEISDTEPDIFRDFLLYLYCGEVERLSSNKVCELYALADKYDTEDLKQECVKFMKCNLSVETVCDVLLLAEKYGEKELNERAKAFVFKKASVVLPSDQWLKLEFQSQLLANQILKSIVLDKSFQLTVEKLKLLLHQEISRYTPDRLSSVLDIEKI